MGRGKTGRDEVRIHDTRLITGGRGGVNEAVRRTKQDKKNNDSRVSKTKTRTYVHAQIWKSRGADTLDAGRQARDSLAEDEQITITKDTNMTSRQDNKTRQNISQERLTRMTRMYVKCTT